MKKIFFLFVLLLSEVDIWAQFNNTEQVRSEFTIILNKFVNNATNKASNEDVLRQLELLKSKLYRSNFTGEDVFKINIAKADVDILKEFIYPISNGPNFHLTDKHLYRLEGIFKDIFKTTKLNVKCPSDEVEFVEIQLAGLRMVYCHNISTKCGNGLKIKYYAASGNMTSRGNFGVLKGEYTPILNNVNTKYLKLISAEISGRF